MKETRPIFLIALVLVAVCSAVGYFLYQKLSTDCRFVGCNDANENTNIVSTTSPKIPEVKQKTEWEYHTYGDFNIPIPKGWTSFEGSKDGGYGSLAVYSKTDSSDRYDIRLIKSSRYVTGPDEVEEEALLDGTMVKGVIRTLPALGSNVHMYKNKEDPTHNLYVVFTTRGGLEISYYTKSSINGNDVLDNISFVSNHSTENTAVPPNLEYIGSHFSRDTKNVYFYGKIVPNADPATFSVIKQGKGLKTIVAKDSNYVFQNSLYQSVTTIPGADPTTFKISTTQADYAHDQYHSYKYGLFPDAQSEQGPYGYYLIGSQIIFD
ncbi:MAG: hypothetical protein AB203_03925 [Parcubacteria bacterium C7867-008]|nr:MAG: hypothetical protein AB203_03925 [Parcubacteria bacterium C7867-008]